MVLSEIEILRLIDSGDIKIEPFIKDNINPASVDLTLAPACKVYTKEAIPKPLQYFSHNDSFIEDWINFENPDHLDCKIHNKTLQFNIPETGFTLLPGHLYLFSCNEKIKIPRELCAEVDGKSSIGRLGVKIHITAGFLDPGFEGSLVLEIETTYPIKIYPNMKICQIKYHMLLGKVAEDYSQKKGSKYMNQEGVVESKYHLNYEG